MRSFLLAATFVVAMAPAAFAGHADKDGPFAHANDNQIGISTPYPGSPVLREDADGQIEANFVGIGQPVSGGPMNGGRGVWSFPNADLAAKP